MDRSGSGFLSEPPGFAPVKCRVLRGESYGCEWESKAVRWITEPIDPELLAQVRTILEPIQDKTWMVGRPENN
jgi:hypothetical protein